MSLRTDFGREKGVTVVEHDIRARIKAVAVEHFDRDGYHGATIRDIAKDAGCSLPTVYYYFKSKKDLFHEIIMKDYFDILRSKSEQPVGSDIIEFYTQYVYSLNKLTAYQKMVYRLGIKVDLSFERDDELEAAMDEWEKSQIPWHFQIIMPHLKAVDNWVVVIRTVMHLLDSLIETIIVKNRALTEEAVREDLTVVLGRALH